MQKLEHIQYIIDNYSSKILNRLKSERKCISVEEAMDVFLDCDPTPNKKLVDWLVKTYIAEGFRWEDVEIGTASKLAEVLDLYQTHFNQIPRDERNIYLYRSYGELYRLVEPYITLPSEDTSMGSREIRRRERARALEESEVFYRSEDMIVAVPLTQSAAVWWGRGTKWCTAADKNNYFDDYNQYAPLIVITLFTEEGAEKFQIWTYGDEVQFVDARDCTVDINIIEKNWLLFEPILLSMINMNGKILELIPKSLRTSELCQRAVEQNGNAIHSVPFEHKTAELYHLALKQNGAILFYIPPELRTYEFCLTAILQDGNALLCVPDQFKTPEFYQLAIETTPQAFRYVPDEYKTMELCKQVVGRDGSCLVLVPDKLKTAELCRTAVNNHLLAITSVPEEFLNAELYGLAIEKNGLLISTIPTKWKTPELCRIAIQQNGLAISSIPSEFITAELCKLAVEQNGLAIGCIEGIHQSDELCKTAIEQNHKAWGYIDNRYKTDGLKKIYEVSKENKKDSLANWDKSIVTVLKQSLENHTVKLDQSDFSQLQNPVF